jgi:hypothetical protein
MAPAVSGLVWVTKAFDRSKLSLRRLDFKMTSSVLETGILTDSVFLGSLALEDANCYIVSNPIERPSWGRL